MDLPEEILVKIYGYVLRNESLDSLHRSVYNVNKEWRTASLNSYILRKIDSSVSKHKLMNLASAGYLKYTEELDLSGIGKTLKRKHFKKIFENAPCLKSLNLSNSPSVSQSFIYLAHNCPDLEALYLQNFNKSLSVRNFKLKSLKEMLKSCGHKIKIIDFSNNFLGAFSIIKNLPILCPNLEELHLADTGESRIVFPIEIFQKLCPKLKVLRLGQFLTFQDSKSEILGFKELEIFEHRCDQGMGPNKNNLKCLLGKSEKLKLLDIRGCFGLDAQTLYALPALNIEYLYLSNSSVCRSINLPHLVCKWNHSLKVFDMSKTNSTIVKEAICNLANYGAPNLTSLNLSSTCVNGKDLSPLIRNCKSLEVLDLGSCQSFEPSMKRIYKGREELESLLNKIDKNLCVHSFSMTLRNKEFG